MIQLEGNQQPERFINEQANQAEEAADVDVRAGNNLMDNIGDYIFCLNIFREKI